MGSSPKKNIVLLLLLPTVNLYSCRKKVKVWSLDYSILRGRKRIVPVIHIQWYLTILLHFHESVRAKLFSFWIHIFMKKNKLEKMNVNLWKISLFFVHRNAPLEGRFQECFLQEVDINFSAFLALLKVRSFRAREDLPCLVHCTDCCVHFDIFIRNGQYCFSTQ